MDTRNIDQPGFDWIVNGESFRVDAIPHESVANRYHVYLSRNDDLFAFDLVKTTLGHWSAGNGAPDGLAAQLDNLGGQILQHMASAVNG